jgi:UTP:GlnB (protein PII) uridylyltransferase
MSTIAEMAGVNVSLLRRSLNQQSIRALQAMDKTMLIATVGTILSTIAKNVHAGDGETSGARASAAVDGAQQEPVVSSSTGQQHQPNTAAFE